MSNEKVLIVNGKRRRTRVDVFGFTKGNRVLVCYRGHMKLPELPGGGVDENETSEEAAKRELMEESGWMANSFVEIKHDEEFIFSGTDSKWFTSEGWDEETNLTVMCQLEEFKPDATFGIEGDDAEYTFIDIEKLYKLCVLAVNLDVSGRLKTMARARLSAIRKIMSKNGHPPSWMEWK